MVWLARCLIFIVSIVSLLLVVVALVVVVAVAVVVDVFQCGNVTGGVVAQ